MQYFYDHYAKYDPNRKIEVTIAADSIYETAMSLDIPSMQKEILLIQGKEVTDRLNGTVILCNDIEKDGIQIILSQHAFLHKDDGLTLVGTVNHEFTHANDFIDFAYGMYWMLFLKLLNNRNKERIICMKIELLKGKEIAIVSSNEKIITDTQSALDLVMTVKYETGTNKIIMEKRNIAAEFFVLSSGMAGEILQKFINYHIKIAIYGDYSKYTSKPLKDFIYESNKGKDVFFVATLDEAIDMLTR